jgi:DNA-binding response OmpR family regulator
MPSLLIIDDDLRLAQMLRTYLRDYGLDVELAADCASGLVRLQGDSFDLAILDLMLPDGDGIDLCRRIRTLAGDAGRLPIVMLTARGDPTDRVIGLESGADDYLPKPFEPRELLARIRAVLRRRGALSGAGTNVLQFGRMQIDRDSRSVRIDDVVRPLTSHQFDLLVAMAERAGRVLTREQLMDFARGEPLEAFDRSIDVHVARIRAAIEDDPKRPQRIITVRGAGYVFAKAQDR